MTRARRSGWAWLGLIVAALVLVALGARRTNTSGSSDDRLFAIAEQLACVQCTGQNVAGSQADIAVEMRAEIRRQMAQERTDDEILSYFADRYGPGVLLNPPASGVAALVWIAPVLVGALALAGLGFVFSRRVRTAPPSDADRALVDDALRGRGT